MIRRVLCAPDSFKESLTALEVAQAMAAGVHRAASRTASASRTGSVRYEPDQCPIADGGEGSLDALIAAMGGEIRTATVTGPLGALVQARFGIAAQQQRAIGIVELAEASGLAIIPKDKRDPTQTTTYGTGELIRHAIDAGCNEIVVCIGGSGTVDGGAGIAQALAVQFYDRDGRLIDQPMTGGMLHKVASIGNRESAMGNRARTQNRVPIRIACDVTNPLIGPDGAAAVYGPQKGATPEQVKLLDENLTHFAKVCGANPETPGFGAAGGAAVGLVTLCGATLESGIDLILDSVNFNERCKDAVLVLTGEGRLDAQSLHGKATMGVATRAKKLGVPTIAIVGSTGEGAQACTDPDSGGDLHAYVSLTDRFGRDRAMTETAQLIAQVTDEIITKTEPQL